MIHHLRMCNIFQKHDIVPDFVYSDYEAVGERTRDFSIFVFCFRTDIQLYAVDPITNALADSDLLMKYVSSSHTHTHARLCADLHHRVVYTGVGKNPGSH